MKVGIDSYCCHRYFGEIYPDQEDPGVRWMLQDFVNRAAGLQADGVSLESCFFESLQPDYLGKIKAVTICNRRSLNAGQRVQRWAARKLVPKEKP